MPCAVGGRRLAWTVLLSDVRECGTRVESTLCPITLPLLILHPSEGDRAAEATAQVRRRPCREQPGLVSQLWRDRPGGATVHVWTEARPEEGCAGHFSSWFSAQGFAKSP